MIYLLLIVYIIVYTYIVRVRENKVSFMLSLIPILFIMLIIKIIIIPRGEYLYNSILFGCY